METKEFEAESKELLKLMINSIYSNKEVFLRELISNASDAIDKYKYIALTSDGKVENKPEYNIRIDTNKEERSITITDNGVGMSHSELINNLGTIAKSGSKDFVKKFKELKNNDDVNIIGQFGVGFYSAFMVAKLVEVTTRKYNVKKGYKFASNGESTYTIEEVEKPESGTSIKIYLKDDKGGEDYSRFLEDYEIESLVKKYSDYIRYPILYIKTESVAKKDDEGKEIEGEYEEVKKEETLNSMIPLWKKNKKDVTEEELNNFYKSTYHDPEDPLLAIYLNVEGMISYNGLVFIPGHAPYDLYSDNYEKGLALYSKGVFIKEKTKELIPDYLKFIKGLVDSSDLNLNISREILQESATLNRIRDSIENKVITNLKDLKDNDFTKYTRFFKTYGNHLKYGIYTSFGTKKDQLIDLIVFKTLKDGDQYLTLKAYKDEMVEGQKYIYYACGNTVEEIKNLPEVEAFKKKGINILLCVDNIDEFTLLASRDYEGVEFKNISEENANELTQEEKDKLDTLIAENKEFLDNMTNALKGKVDEVTFSTKLVESPVCISTKSGLSMKMENVLNNIPKDSEEEDVKSSKVLEINPDHDLFKAIKVLAKNEEDLKDYASLLYNEAILLEGYDIKDKETFTKTLNKIIIASINKDGGEAK